MGNRKELQKNTNLLQVPSVELLRMCNKERFFKILIKVQHLISLQKLQELSHQISNKLWMLLRLSTLKTLPIRCQKLRLKEITSTTGSHLELMVDKDCLILSQVKEHLSFFKQPMRCLSWPFLLPCISCGPSSRTSLALTKWMLICNKTS